MKPVHPALLPALSRLVSCLLVPQQQQPGQQLEQQRFSRGALFAPNHARRFPRKLFEPDAAVLRNSGLCSGMTCDSSSGGQAPLAGSKPKYK
jgi:hypothetical protein